MIKEGIIPRTGRFMKIETIKDMSVAFLRERGRRELKKAKVRVKKRRFGCLAFSKGIVSTLLHNKVDIWKYVFASSTIAE